MNIADLDIENLEKIIEAEKDNQKSDKKRRKSQSSSSESSKHRSKKKHDKKSKKHGKKHSFSKSRSRSSSDYRRKKKEKEKQRKIDEREREIERKQKEKEDSLRRQKQEELEMMKRDASTVMVLNLSLKINEKHLYTFFKSCGKIRDIRLIKNPKTGRSKGVAYVEFFQQESVIKAVALTRRSLEDCNPIVQPSQAEKNRYHTTTKTVNYYSNQSSKYPAENLTIYVRGLTGSLAYITEKDLEELFKAIGEIDSIDLKKEPITQKSIGFAVIKYKNYKHAKKAIETMNGFEINDQKITVSSNPIGPMASSQQQQPVYQQDLDYDDGNSYLHSSQSKFILMQKLTRQSQY